MTKTALFYAVLRRLTLPAPMIRVCRVSSAARFASEPTTGRSRASRKNCRAVPEAGNLISEARFSLSAPLYLSPTWAGIG